MSRSRLFVVCALLIAGAAQAEERPYMPSMAREPSSVGMRERALIEAPSTRLIVGDNAPRFSYLGIDGEWHTLATMLEQGSVLLIFGAAESDLRSIEKERAAFVEMNVTPLPILDVRTTAAAAMAKRLGMTDPIAVDPKRAIAGLYNSLDPMTLRHAPAFFLLDTNGSIRALYHGPLPTASSLVSVSAESLGLPVPVSAWSLVHPQESAPSTP